MNKLLFLITFLIPGMLFAKESPPDIYISLKNCVQILTPLFLGEETVLLQENYSKSVSCKKFKEVYVCRITDSRRQVEKMFVSKTDDKKVIKFGDLKNEETFTIKDRAVFYNNVSMKTSDKASFIYNESCQGSYSNRSHVEKIKVYNLGFELNSIFRNMIEESVDE